MSKTIDDFLQSVDRICGAPGEIYRVTESDESRAVLVSSYPDTPEPGCRTSFTFGLSSAVHSEWRLGRPELMLSVRSDDTAWGLCMGEIVRTQRDRILFEQGSILNFGQQISSESLMSSFLVFASNLLDASSSRFEFDDRVINISQLYPIHESEGDTILSVGLERFFWEMGIDFEDVRRKPVTVS